MAVRPHPGLKMAGAACPGDRFPAPGPSDGDGAAGRERICPSSITNVKYFPGHPVRLKLPVVLASAPPKVVASPLPEGASRPDIAELAGRCRGWQPVPTISAGRAGRNAQGAAQPARRAWTAQRAVEFTIQYICSSPDPVLVPAKLFWGGDPCCKVAIQPLSL